MIRTLRGRVFAGLALTAVVCTVLTVAVASLVLEHQARERREATLSRVADVTAPLLAATLPAGARGGGGGADGAGASTIVARVPSLALPAGLRRLRVVRGAARRRVLDAVGDRGDGASGRIGLAARSVLFAVRDTDHGRVVLLAPAGDRAVTGPPPARTVLLAGAGGLLVALLLGALVTRRLTAPVTAAADAARALAAGGATVPVPEDGPAEFRELGRAFNAMAADLAQARAAEQRFLTSVSHELKTPLAAVRGYAEAIADGAVPPPDAARVIGEEALRLERLVGDLLDLARLRQADFTVRREPIDFAAIAHAAVARHRLAAQTGDVTLVVDAPAPAPAVGDDGRALQIASNLVENALRVVPAHGRVVVRARPGRLEVEDDGPGLSAEELPRAFERFYLHDRRRAEHAVGSGLGLALVAELAGAMDGSVSVSSRPSEATIFAVALPR